MARSVLADAARVAHWADAALRPGREGTGSDGKGTLSAATAERAAADLGLTSDQVHHDWDTARLAGLVEVYGDSARPGWRLRAWNRDDSAVLRSWVAFFDAWSIAHPEPADREPAAVAEVVSAMPQVLSFLQLSAGPVPVEQLLDLLDQRVTELRTERCEIPYGPQAEASVEPSAMDTPLAPLLDWSLRALASVGALTYGDGQAALTPLGSWAVWVKLEQICVAAQSPAGTIEVSAEDMLRGCAQLRPNAARAEYRAWLAARPVGSAVTELIDAARGEDALIRGLAFEALRVVGAPAEPDVRTVAAETPLRPYALLWLAEHDGADPEDAIEVLTRAEVTWLWVDTAAAVADHGEAPLLVRHLESAVQPTIPALLDEVRAVGHPRTVQVLVALAAAHPDPVLAKAVRRAAFQVHTGAPPRCRAQLTLVDDDPSAGTPVRLTVQLVAESGHPWARPGAPPPLDIVALPLSSADVVPAAVLYDPENTESAEFRVMAAEPGTHRIRFTFLHHDTGVALQQVETDLDVAAADLPGAGTRPLWPRRGGI